MTTLADLISAIPDWGSLTPQSLFSILVEKNIPYRDDTDWTWKGIASVVNHDTGNRFGREGCKRLQDALKAAGEELWVSQISAGMPLTDPEIQGVLRHLDQTGAVPGARHIADAVMRNISQLEHNNIITTTEEVAQVQALMLLERRKQEILSANAVRWNAFYQAVNSWDGTGPEPEF
jgi:hypothetical protein